MAKKMDHCCNPNDSHNHSHAAKRDYLLWVTLAVIVPCYLLAVFLRIDEQIIVPDDLKNFSTAIFHLVHAMWWGVAFGIVFVGLLDNVPREFVIAILGRNAGVGGIIRATLAGMLLDLCSHGILLIGAKLYERGASLGQIMAFLIASPWNSFSLTLILWSLVGFWWMLTFLLLSLVIAIISGIIFEVLVGNNILPNNPNRENLPTDFRFMEQAKEHLRGVRFDLPVVRRVLVGGIQSSRMIMRWLFLGIIISAALRTFMPIETFQSIFGPSLVGLGLTLVFATIIEVCSEGATPIAADILNRAHAGGNSFAFLMAGVSTDYTEIMVLKETTKSWKISLFLPLITLPQVILMAWLLNHVPV